MTIRSIKSLVVILTVLTQSAIFAQQESTDTKARSSNDIFARQGSVVLTHSELDAAFSRIPPEFRLAFIRDGAKVDDLVKSLLRLKLVAADASRSGFDQQPMIAERMQLAAEKELAEAWVGNLIENAPEADYEALALEYYLAHPDEFKMPERVDVSHILISSETRSEEKALALATRLHDDLRTDPSQFDGYVTEYSEDPAKTSNAGRYPGMQRGQMVKRFEEAAFTLQQPGDITEPVKTSYGYHIIRLNQAKPSAPIPFEQIKEQASEMAKEQYLSEYRARYIKQQIAEPIELADGAAEAMVKRYFGEELELIPEFPE
ncbi:MAG: peptidylprolyl isomerase [Gammaproteobacteria bacterium]|nr:peptidylprolyl isomerase [Gammaproteobacteria bacterium]